MHCQWRLYAPLIMHCAKKVGNEQVKADWTVAKFNQHRHFFKTVVVACSEYVNYIAATPGAPDLRYPKEFMGKADQNIDFAWICHFLYEAGPRRPPPAAAARVDACADARRRLARRFFCTRIYSKRARQ